MLVNNINDSDKFFLDVYFKGIGDHMVLTPIPEVLFNIYGKRTVMAREDKDVLFGFKYNPYVDFLDKSQRKNTKLGKINYLNDSRNPEVTERYIKERNTVICSSQIDYILFSMGINKPASYGPRHPVIYRDYDVDHNKITIHTTGSDRTKHEKNPFRKECGEDDVRIMSDDIIDHILYKYKGFDIFQVGGESDKPIDDKNVTDLRGCDIDECVSAIGSSRMFIGVDSGLMHISNSFENVETKIVLQQYPEDTLLRFLPGDIRNYNFSWLDITNKYYNKYKHDIGFSFTYTKL